jgi:hypothetical protein
MQRGKSLNEVGRRVSFHAVDLCCAGERGKLRRQPWTRPRTPPGKNSTSLRLGDIPAGASEGSRRVTQVPKTFNGNGEKESMDMVRWAFVALPFLRARRRLDRASRRTKEGYCSFLKIP